MAPHSTSQQLRALIAQGKLRPAIDRLLTATDGTDLHQDVLMQSAAFQGLEQDSRNGLISEAEKNLRRAQITHALLHLIDELPKTADGGGSDSGDHGHKGGSDGRGNAGRGEGPITLAPNPLFPALSGLGLLLGIVLVVVFVPCPSSAQFIVFRIALAMGAAGLAVVIPGFFEFDYKPYLRAGGALAIFAFVYLINPAAAVSGGDGCNQPFDLAVFLTDADGATPLKNEGSLSLRFENENRSEAIDAKGSANFRQMPAQADGDTVVAELAAAGWQFANGKTVMPFPVNGTHATLTIQRDSALYCCIRGSVRDGNNRFLPGVRLGIGDQFVASDSNGRFAFVIPVARQAERYDLVATHPGYRNWEATVYPATRQETKIVLQK